MVNPQLSIDAMKQQRALDGDKANFVTLRSGLPFNCLDDKWQHSLTGEGLYVNLTWLHDSSLSHEEQVDVRYVFANILSNRKGAKTYISAFKSSKIKQLTISEFKDAIIKADPNKRSRLKTFATVLAQYNEEKYSEIDQYMKTVAGMKKISKPYDPEKGAFSEYERLNITTNLNEYAKKATNAERAKELFPPCSSNSTVEGVMGNFLTLRLMQVYTRRPVQLATLKWGHLISNDGSIEQFVDARECLLRMPMAKQKTDTIECIFESAPQIVCEELVNEIIPYRTYYAETFFSKLREQGFEFSPDEANFLFAYLPMFPSALLFSTDFSQAYSDKHTLISHFKSNKDGFHQSGNGIAKRISTLVKQLPLDSDRVVNMKLSNNRFRHDQGTEMGKDGYDIIYIAEKLGNTPDAAKVYVDLSPEMRASTNLTMANDTSLSQAFSGKLTEKIRGKVTDEIAENEIAIKDLKRGELGKSAHLPHCLSCVQARPISCYGCDDFHPLNTGDHRGVLAKVQAEYDKKLVDGHAEKGLIMYRHKIKAIAATIVACDAFNQQLTIEVKEQ